MVFFRLVISAVLVGVIATGNALQVAISNGQEPSKWQIYSAIIGGLVLALNDIKSRLTPPPGAESAATVRVTPEPVEVITHSAPPVEPGTPIPRE